MLSFAFVELLEGFVVPWPAFHGFKVLAIDLSWPYSRSHWHIYSMARFSVQYDNTTTQYGKSFWFWDWNDEMGGSKQVL